MYFKCEKVVIVIVNKQCIKSLILRRTGNIYTM